MPSFQDADHLRLTIATDNVSAEMEADDHKKRTVLAAFRTVELAGPRELRPDWQLADC